MRKTGSQHWNLIQLLLIAACLLWAGNNWAQTKNGWSWYQPRKPEPPKWSLELKYGDFEPELSEFQTFYDQDKSKHSAIAVGYKLLRAVEVGLEYGYMKNQGVGQLPLNNSLGGDVTFTVQPAHAYLLIRGIWGEDQIGVPYFGGGITQVAYKQTIANQSNSKGKANGNHWRYGLQFLIDRADVSLAREMEGDYGVNNIYLFIEKQHYEADVEGIELGGETLFMGLLFEF